MPLKSKKKKKFFNQLNLMNIMRLHLFPIESISFYNKLLCNFICFVF